MRLPAAIGALVLLAAACGSPATSGDLPLAERLRLERQWEFVTNFMPPNTGGCSGSGPTTASHCVTRIETDLLSGPVEIEIKVDGDDDVPLLTTGMDKARSALEASLGRLYVWALETAPEQTESACGFAEKTRLETFAWEPGYRAQYECGEHLASLTDEFLGS